jgi:O-antigen/teichoic acid export membrane protein
MARRLAASGLWLGVAKVTFLIAGYATSVVLSRLVEPTIFGNYGVLARLVAIPNMVIVQSLSFAVSRPLANEYLQGMPSYFALRRRGFRMALLLGGLFGLGLWLGAGLISDQLHDETLALPLRLLAPISLLYALYAVNVGTLNAARSFLRQAGLDIFMACTKASLIIGAAALGWGLSGLSGAFTLASAAALALSVLLVRSTRPTAKNHASETPGLGSLVLALLATTAAAQVLLSTDILLLKAFATDANARASVGFYAGAQLVAMVPYSLLNAVNLLVFPLIASLNALDPAHAQARRRYVSRTIEAMLLLIGGLAAVLSGGAQQVATIIFPASYGQAAEDLRWLAFGYSGYALGLNAVWILNSAGMARQALLLVVAVLGVAASLHFVLIPDFAHRGADMAVLASGIFAALLGVIALARTFGARPAGMTFFKIAAATALTTVIGFLLADWTPFAGLWPQRILGLLELAGLFAFYLAFIVGSKAVSREFIAEIRGKGQVA